MKQVKSVKKMVEIADLYVSSFKRDYIRVADREKMEFFNKKTGIKLTLVPVVYSATWSKWSAWFTQITDDGREIGIGHRGTVRNMIRNGYVD